MPMFDEQTIKVITSWLLRSLNLIKIIKCTGLNIFIFFKFWNELLVSLNCSLDCMTCEYKQKLAQTNHRTVSK